VNWIEMVRDEVQCRVFVKMVLNGRFYKSRKLLDWLSK
jgi:hypothetical protein